ncbi:arylsulfatase [Mycobacterium sp. Y57]|nr:arylsulfatase [Mycolicibacterium xanthum]MBX7434179.1 arylsulfatase [Mycolicibacterium xanthum]
MREVLPIPDPRYVGLTTYDARDPNTKYPPITTLRPPPGAPNVLIILLDDVGFGASSAFGGPCDTPAAERLAAGGLKLNRFHTTALCSPTRQALLTGRNHHSVGMGGVTEMATSAPGYSSVRPKDKSPVAETLKLNGYSTAQFGKCHEVPVWEVSPVGPFQQWPTGSGFEYFYGFVGGETHQYYPRLFEGTTAVQPPRTPEEGYTLNEDLADHAIDWVRQQQAITPDKPFFMYFAPGATHSPHHVHEQWVDKYRGRFDRGWDALREEILARQKKLGVVPENAELTRRPAEIPAWDDMPVELKPVLAREMEIYAGFLEHTDHEVGRLIDALEEVGVLDDTLIIYIIGDNGASAEGTPNGCFNEIAVLNGMSDIETPEFLLSKIDDFGTPRAHNHYAVGWAHAMCTPYQWTKQIASHWGGTRNGTIVHWPRRLTDSGSVRNQFHHVIDVTKTILEAAGLPEPTSVNGIDQAPLEGVSMLPTLLDTNAPDIHDVQYFEMFGNRGIYHQGWTAVTKHRTPWLDDAPPLEEDVWELYGPDDWSQAHNLSHENPEKLADLQRLWLVEAVKYNVLPLDDRAFERFNADIAGRPQLICGNRQTMYPGMRLNENCMLNLKNKSHSVTVSLIVPEIGAAGVVIAHGTNVGGWSLYAHDGKLTYCYNLLGIEHYFVTADEPLTAGAHQVRMEFAYDGGGLGKGGDVTLYCDAKAVGQGRVEQTQPMILGVDESCDVGVDSASPVSPHYGPTGNGFTGSIDWAIVEIGEDSHEHLISPEQRMNVAMTRQ